MAVLTGFGILLGVTFCSSVGVMLYRGIRAEQ